MIESTFGDPSIEAQRDIFANAIESAVKRAGFIDKDAVLTGPHLLQFLDELVDMYLDAAKRVENVPETP